MSQTSLSTIPGLSPFQHAKFVCCFSFEVFHVHISDCQPDKTIGKITVSYE